MKSLNGDKFVYSAYWRTWSRILSPYGALPVGQVEVDLTAVNPTSAHGWPKVSSINIRAHRTAQDFADIVTDDLPDSVLELMQVRIDDQEIIDHLLHADLLPQIDWYTYRKICNGGASFNAIKIIQG